LKEQCFCTKVYFDLGKDVTEACEMLQVAFGEQTVGKNTHFLVVSKIQSGVGCITDGSGCLLTNKISKNICQVKELVLKNRRIIVFGVTNIRKYIWVSSEHFQRQSEYVQISINSFPSWRAWNRRRVMSGYGRTSKKGFKGPRNFFRDSHT